MCSGSSRTSCEASLHSSGICRSWALRTPGVRDAARPYVPPRSFVSNPHDRLVQVIKAYETQGFDMLLKAFNEPGYLEALTGLDQLHAEGEAALEAVDWEEDAEDDF